jgi:hypothetical protein
VTQVASHRPLSTKAWVRFQAFCVGFMVDELVLGHGFLRVLFRYAV